MILRATMIGSLARGYEMVGNVAEKIARAAQRPIDPQRVHVRTFLAANSRPSKDGMIRIREKAIRKFAKLYPGAPLMRNHGLFDSDDMPIGRVFDAAHETQDDKAENLMLSFYTARDDEIGDRAARNVDLGIWSESSIHGYFETFDCSICGKSLDMDRDEHCSEHEIGTEYDGEMARIELDDPSEAPEFSLCWSGRLAGTRALAQEIPDTVSAFKFIAQRRSWLQQMKNGTAARPLTWMEELNGNLETQAIVCSREHFKSVADARAFVEGRGMEAGNLVETMGEYRFPRFPLAEGLQDSFRTKCVASGVSLVLCRRKSG